MKRVAGLCLPPLALLTSILMLSAASVKAAETDWTGSGRAFLLAEIVVPTQQDGGQKARKSAAEVRDKAKTYQESTSGSPAIVVVPEEEEEGLLGPRRQPESGASVNRTNARRYQQGDGVTSVPVLPGRDSGASGAATTAQRASENRAKARNYVSTDNAVVIERIGSDGIPIVSCGKMIANVAGRIGDDMQPGGIILIMRDNKPFKVRCAQQ